MGATLEQENALRRIKGEPLLDKLPEDNSDTDTLAAKPDSSLENNPSTENAATPAAPTINSEAVMAYLREQGIEVSSLDDLKKKPTEDPEKIAEERQAAILTFGLQKGKFNTKTYESYIRDISDPQNVVFQQYRNAAKEEDADLTEEEIQQEFSAKYGLDAEPGTRRHKRGQQEIGILSQNLLHQRYTNIFDAEKDFVGYESAQKQKSEQERKVTQGLPAYKSTLEKVFVNLNKIPAKFSDETEYSVDAAEVLKDSIQELQTTMSSPEYVAQKITQGYTPEQLQQEAWGSLLIAKWPVLVEEIAKQHLLKHKAGTQGIPPKGPQAKTQEVALTPEQQTAKDRIFGQTQLAN